MTNPDADPDTARQSQVDQLANSPLHVQRAVAQVMAAVTAIPKHGEMRTSKGGPVQYRFRRWEDIVTAVGAAFRAAHVAVQSEIRDVTYHRWEKQSSSGNITLWTACTIVARYQLVSLVDGSAWPVEAAGEGTDSSDKATNKAMTSCYKNALQQLLMLSDGDPNEDPDHSRPEVSGLPAAPDADQQPQQQGDLSVQAAQVVVGKLNTPGLTTGDLDALARYAQQYGAMAVPVGQSGQSLRDHLLVVRQTLPGGPARQVRA